MGCGGGSGGESSGGAKKSRAAGVIGSIAKAYGLVSSAAAQGVRHSRTGCSPRLRYTAGPSGQCALLAARRGGLRFVEMVPAGTCIWCFPASRRLILQPTGLSTVVEDLDEARALGARWWVMKGRTPQVNAQAGRDHWSNALNTCLFARRHQTRSGDQRDNKYASAVSDPVGVNDITENDLPSHGDRFNKIYYSPSVDRSISSTAKKYDQLIV